jgi:drug/metabolite transporter (DMT)-like permease
MNPRLTMAAKAAAGMLFVLLPGSAQAHSLPYSENVFWLLLTLTVLAFPLLFILVVLDKRRAAREGRRGFRPLWILCAAYSMPIMSVIAFTVMTGSSSSAYVYIVVLAVIPLASIAVWVYALASIAKYVARKRAKRRADYVLK